MAKLYAEKVRLLYVLLLAPVGVAAGLVAAYLVMVIGASVAVTIIGSIVAGVFIVIPVGIIIAIIYLLHNIVVWKN